MEVIGIAAVTANGYIARHKNERISWSRDLPLFQKQTGNYPVIMGSTTYKTISKGLPGRQMIVVKSPDSPEMILRKIKHSRCFVIGGGKTFSKFARHLTHLYLTMHPIIFKRGIRVFSEIREDIFLSFIQMIPVIEAEGIFQFQYKLIKADKTT